MSRTVQYELIISRHYACAQNNSRDRSRERRGKKKNNKNHRRRTQIIRTLRHGKRPFYRNYDTINVHCVIAFQKPARAQWTEFGIFDFDRRFRFVFSRGFSRDSRTPSYEFEFRRRRDFYTINAISDESCRNPRYERSVARLELIFLRGGRGVCEKTLIKI